MVDVTCGADDHEPVDELGFKGKRPALLRAPCLASGRGASKCAPRCYFFTVVSASSNIHDLYGTKLTRLLTAYSFEGAYKNRTLASSWM